MKILIVWSVSVYLFNPKKMKNNAENFYERFNRTPKVRVRTGKGVEPKMKIPKSDLDNLEKIISGTKIAKSIIEQRKERREDEMQEWINQNSPSPFEILRKVAEECRSLHNILNKIVDELEAISKNPLPPKQSSDREKRAIKNQLADILIESHDIEAEIYNLKVQENELYEKLEIAKKNRDQAKQTYLDYERIVNRGSFGQYYDMKKKYDHQKEMDNVEYEAELKHKSSIEYSQLWGESRHLRDEITKFTDKLEENRAFQLKFAQQQALKCMKKKSIEKKKDDVVIMEEDEWKEETHNWDVYENLP